jgi:hypothetical protein
MTARNRLSRPIPVSEMGLQPLHGVPPFRRAGLADGVLIAEEAQLIHCLLHGHGIQPLHAHKILRFRRVVQVLLVKSRAIRFYCE